MDDSSWENISKPEMQQNVMVGSIDSVVNTTVNGSGWGGIRCVVQSKIAGRPTDLGQGE